MTQVSQATVDLVKQFEGFISHWYPDPALGWKVPTCCYGHTDAAGPPRFEDDKGRQFTEAEGSQILAADLGHVADQVLKLLVDHLTPNQMGALVSFAFNLGIGNLAKSTLLRKVNAGDYAAAAGEFKKWNKAGGRVLPGLVKRRAAEAKLFSTP